MKLTDFYSKQKIDIDGDINMYVCGPTVYSDPHVGNMRPIIIYDILNRVASIKGNVNFVHNITDVDDKIIARAEELNISEKELSEKYEREYLELLKDLNIKMPTHMPKVTDNIEGMVEFISKLIDKGYAYESNGSVYFSVNDFDDYASLLGGDLDDLNNNEDTEDKKDPKDFALWKKTEKGVKWNSPWGEGRPGWHTECSYFIEKYFGENGLDIHGGGIDLKFPHHINEMAQYEACCGSKHTSKVWSYVGHINFGETKMSKSLGNLVSAKDFINEHGSLVLRMLMLQTSILNPINLNDDSVSNAVKLVDKIINALRKALITLATDTDYVFNTSDVDEEFVSILEDDLNVANAITYILNQIKIINTSVLENEKLLEKIISNLSMLGFEFDIKLNELKEQIKQAKLDSNYEILDKLKGELLSW